MEAKQQKIDEPTNTSFVETFAETVKTFKDPIHGPIDLPFLCNKIIDTRQFQRLRNIKQLGVSYYVYPGASHNRFEHAIGVCHLAGLLVKKLQHDQQEMISRGKDVSEEDTITETDVLCVQIAGLCHDIGHGPFSHVFDIVVKKVMEEENDIEEWTHEQCSQRMFEYMLEDPDNMDLKDNFNKWDEENQENVKHLEKPKRLQQASLTCREFIKELIDPSPRDDESKRRPKNFLYEIVSNKANKVDVDKWDYFARDCHHLGHSNGCDHLRMIKFARVIDVDGNTRICYREKVAHSLYEMFHTREMLHRLAYQHKTTLIVGEMIARALSEGFKRRAILKGITMKECLEKMDNFVKLDDSIFWNILNSANVVLDSSRRILQRINSRRLYRYVGKARPKTFLDKKEMTKLKKRIMDELQMQFNPNGDEYCNPNSVVILEATFDLGKTGENFMDKVYFYTKYDLEKAFTLDRDEVSLMLPGEFSEQILYFYITDGETDEAVQKATDSLAKACDKIDGLRERKMPKFCPVMRQNRK